MHEFDDKKYISTLKVAALSVQTRQLIQDYVYMTPLLPARAAGKEQGCSVLFKGENFQRTGSFKVRGAFSKLTRMPKGQRFVTASSGNHGIGASYAAQILQKDLSVVLPKNVVLSKLEKIKSHGANVILHGDETGQAELYAQELAATQGYIYISPYNDLDIIAGQGTIGLELLEQNNAIDAIFIAMGGGGLISGIASVFKSFSPKTKIYGVSAKNSQALALSMAAKKVVETEHLDTIADAVAGGIDTDTVTLPIARETIDETIVCDEQEIASALRQLAFEENMIVEGAAALAFAGFQKCAHSLKDKTAVIVLCGANYDEVKMRQILSL